MGTLSTMAAVAVAVGALLAPDLARGPPGVPVNCPRRPCTRTPPVPTDGPCPVRSSPSSAPTAARSPAPSPTRRGLRAPGARPGRVPPRGHGGRRAPGGRRTRPGAGPAGAHRHADPAALGLHGPGRGAPAGIVRDGGGTAPLRGALAVLLEAGGTLVRIAATDADGRFSLRDARPRTGAAGRPDRPGCSSSTAPGTARRPSRWDRRRPERLPPQLRGPPGRRPSS
ncbi:hypothetical protein ACFQ60_32140 [Streptomyces zhihengii]